MVVSRRPLPLVPSVQCSRTGTYRADSRGGRGQRHPSFQVWWTTTSVVMTQYPLDQAWQHERQRLAQLEAVLDPWTTQRFEALGVSDGWHCLEVGAGGGSITEWLCQRVGPTGRVVGADLDPRFLAAITAPNLEVHRHDIAVDDLPEATFDLIHTRVVLCFLPNRDAALRKMVAALKPGGWLLTEESDYSTIVPDPGMAPDAAALYLKGWAALSSFVAAGGYDIYLGRRLHHALASVGLEDIDAAGFVPTFVGGGAGARFVNMTFEQLGDQFLAAGLLTQDEMAGFRALLERADFRWYFTLLLSAWGRRPSA